MRLIGMTGKAGAGKTTFSNMLAENSNIDVIHIDDILRKIKLKYFKMFLKKNKDGERTRLSSKTKHFIYKQKTLFNLFMKFRAKIVEKPLKREIQRLQSAGVENIIIDDIFIKYQKIYKDLSEIFLVKRPYVERKLAVQERDKITKKEVVVSDMVHYNGTYTEILENKKVYKINNTGSEEDLRKKAKQVYKEHFITFKEKYKQEQANKIKNTVIEQSKNIEKHNEERC